MSLLRRHVAAPLGEGRALRQLAFVASAIPLGTAWFVLLVTGWSLGLGLLITLLGLPVLLALAFAVRGGADLERLLADALLGTRLGGGRPVWTGSFLRSLWGWLSDPAAWREQAYLLLRFVAGIPLGAVALGVIFEGLRTLTAPLHYYAWGDGFYGFWEVDTFSEAVLLVPVGVVLLGLSVPLITGMGALWAFLARGLLAAGEPRRAAERGPRPVAAPATGPRRGAPRGLAIHATVYATLNAALIVIWLSTTPGGYFWPVWPLLALGLILGIHAIVVLAPRLFPDSGRRAVALARHVGVAAAVALFLTLIWAVTTPGAYFWPIWPILALAATVALSAAIVAVGVGRREAEAAERIDVLQTTRAGAVGAQTAELQRIERDLHDGAQARLVALAMDLGLAKDKMTDDDARALVEGAHEEAKRALVELRGLARGIHPAVLSDRGLEAALGSLTGASRIPVELRVDTGGRLDPPLEAAAYFVVAEALANAAKHSGASAVRVDLEREDDVLTVRVADDGVGGADPGGNGLTGLRRRVEAHDGRLTLDSPGGGGTTLTAELPCGS